MYDAQGYLIFVAGKDRTGEIYTLLELTICEEGFSFYEE